jgi:hypothetical protein
VLAGTDHVVIVGVIANVGNVKHAVAALEDLIEATRVVQVGRVERQPAGLVGGLGSERDDQAAGHTAAGRTRLRQRHSQRARAPRLLAATGSTEARTMSHRN